MKSKLNYLYAFLFIFILWQMAAWLTDEMVVAGPVAVFARLSEEFSAGKIWIHLSASFYRISIALILAFFTAVPLGLFLGLSRKADGFAKPLIYISYPIPKIVLMPIIMLIFGIGETSKIVLLWMILFFQLLITTRDAARGVNKSARYSLISLGGRKIDLFIHVIWPSCLPNVLTALRITTGTMVAVLFLIESIGTRHGMGFYIIDAWGRIDVERIFVGMVVLAAIGIFFYELFDALEKKFCQWNRL